MTTLCYPADLVEWGNRIFTVRWSLYRLSAPVGKVVAGLGEGGERKADAEEADGRNKHI
jgi:hypothetical protein